MPQELHRSLVAYRPIWKDLNRVTEGRLSDFARFCTEEGFTPWLFTQTPRTGSPEGKVRVFFCATREGRVSMLDYVTLEGADSMIGWKASIIETGEGIRKNVALIDQLDVNVRPTPGTN